MSAKTSMAFRIPVGRHCGLQSIPRFSENKVFDGLNGGNRKQNKSFY